jgi:8-oxo-dGTP pyrophosphatase MutT (NUDIX family)
VSVSLIEQAGAIVFGMRDGAPAVLLVTAKRNPDQWVFPKGHVERGETLEGAALREAEEEAGVTGEILQSAGTLEFILGKDTIRVHYFVMFTGDQGEAESGRRAKWLSPEDALDRLSFENSRKLLRSVWPHVEPRVRSAVPSSGSGR